MLRPVPTSARTSARILTSCGVHATSVLLADVAAWAPPAAGRRAAAELPAPGLAGRDALAARAAGVPRELPLLRAVWAAAFVRWFWFATVVLNLMVLSRAGPPA